MLRVRGLRRRYGSVIALDGVDLDIARGEVAGLLGPNGAGKSTLVSAVCGLRRPDSGSVSVAGLDVSRHPWRVRELIGLAPQELGLYPTLTVFENLLFFTEVSGRRGRAARARIEAVAEALALTGLLRRPAHALSGGQKRRLHVALALVHHPRLLLLDEPTAGVDVETRAALLDLVRAAADDGVAVCYCTHYLPEVEALNGSVAILDRGRVIARGSVRELVRRHGGSRVELTFVDRVPQVPLPWPAVQDGLVLRLEVDNPPLAAARAIELLGAEAARLRSVEIVRPSLESVFVALTGRRFAADRPAADSPPADPPTADPPTADPPAAEPPGAVAYPGGGTPGPAGPAARQGAGHATP
jgi:ABC-2 type transport system ATP-binding protein